MTEPFGILSGAVGIAAAFTTCVDCFKYVQLGRHFGTDFQTGLITLSLLRLRLTRWGEAVNVYEDPQLGDPNASQDALSTAKNTLFQILVLFADSETTAKKFRFNSRSADLSVYSTADLSFEVLSLDNKMADIAKKRQKKKGLFKLSSWALYHGEQFTKLTDNIAKLLDQLEKLFPAADTQRRLLDEEMKDLKGQQQFQNLEDLMAKMDHLLQEAFKNNNSPQQNGLTVNEIDIGNQVRLQNGDHYANDWTGYEGASNLPASKTHVAKLTAKDTARIQNGSSYGGKGIFDD